MLWGLLQQHFMWCVGHSHVFSASCEKANVESSHPSLGLLDHLVCPSKVSMMSNP